MWNQLLNRRDIGVAQLEGEKVHDRRSSINADVELCHRSAGLEQLGQLRDIGLGYRPFGTENLEPALVLQRPHHCDGILFVSNLLNFISNRAAAEKLNVLTLARRIVTGTGALLEFPSETRCEARCANQSRRVLQKRVAMQNANQPRFDIGSAVEGIEE